jgi:hypothetical protein
MEGGKLGFRHMCKAQVTSLFPVLMSEALPSDTAKGSPHHSLITYQWHRSLITAVVDTSAISQPPLRRLTLVLDIACPWIFRFGRRGNVMYTIVDTGRVGL